CSIGPVGAFDFSSIRSGSRYRLDETGQNGDRDRNIAHCNQDGEDLRESLYPWRVNRMTESQRLEHAPQPVIEVVAKHDHRNDVEDRYRPNLKPGYDVAVDVVRIEWPTRMHYPERELQ